MTKEELTIYDEHPTRRNVRVENIRRNKEYVIVEPVPYIESTIYRKPRKFGSKGLVCIATGCYVDKESGVLMQCYRDKNSFAGCSLPIGMFGFYFKPLSKIKK